MKIRALRKFRLIALTLMVVLFPLILIAGKFFCSEYLKTKLENEISASCFHCNLKIENLDLSLLTPGEVSFANIKFSSGEEGGVQVFASLHNLTLHASPSQLMRHHVRIRNLLAYGFDVKVVDGDKPSSHPKAQSETPASYDFKSEPLKYRDGAFQYVRPHEGVTATIHVHEINGTLSAIDPTSDQIIKGLLTARFENSGATELEVLTNPFLKPLRVDMKLTVSDQDLADLSHFLEPNAGVKLTGKIDQGAGVVSITGKTLKATDWIIYEKLQAKVEKGKDYSGLGAFFENIGLGLTMQTKNDDLSRAGQTKSVELKKEDNESVVSFILRGLKEAALKVATRSNMK